MKTSLQAMLDQVTVDVLHTFLLYSVIRCYSVTMFNVYVITGVFFDMFRQILLVHSR